MCAGNSESFHFSAALGVGRNLKDSLHSFNERERARPGTTSPELQCNIAQHKQARLYTNNSLLLGYEPRRSLGCDERGYGGRPEKPYLRQKHLRLS